MEGTREFEIAVAALDALPLKDTTWQAVCLIAPAPLSLVRVDDEEGHEDDE